MRGRFAAGPVSVRREADAPADGPNEKDLQMQAFPRAAEGIRTLDLLHGKQGPGLGAARNIPANTPLLPRERVPPMSGFHRGITGVSGLKPDWC
jgi:hypothetical protein